MWRPICLLNCSPTGSQHSGQSGASTMSKNLSLFSYRTHTNRGNHTLDQTEAQILIGSDGDDSLLGA